MSSIFKKILQSLSRPLTIVVADAAALVGSINIIYAARLDFSPPILDQYIGAVFLVVIISIYLFGCNEVKTDRSPNNFAIWSFVSVLAAGVFIGAAIYLIPPPIHIAVFWRGNLPLSLFLFAIYLSSSRYLLRRAAGWLVSNEMFGFVGSAENFRNLLVDLKARGLEASFSHIDNHQVAEFISGTAITEGAEKSSDSGISERSDDRHQFSAFILDDSSIDKAGKAPVIMVTGGNVFMQAGLNAEAAYSKSILQDMGVPSEAILIEVESRNTRQSAVNSRRILGGLGVDQILLVTSGIHMPRAAEAFGAVGFDVLASPSGFATVDAQGPTILAWMPSLAILSRSHELTREYIGLFVYQLRGWLR